MQNCNLSSTIREIEQICKSRNSEFSSSGSLLVSTSLPSPVLECDSNDSLSKCVEESLTLPATTLLSLQMQKHLLSSTMQNSPSVSKFRGGSSSPTAVFSIAPTPALNFAPTPSSSPFSSMPDLNFTLSSDPKSLDFSLEPKLSQFRQIPNSNSNYVEFVDPLEHRTKLNSAVSGQNMLQQSVSSLEQIPNDLSYGSATNQPIQSISGQTDVKLLLVESSPSSIPNNLALLAPQPLGLLQPTTGPRFSFPVSSNSSYPTTSFPTTCPSSQAGYPITCISSQISYPTTCIPSSCGTTISTNLIHPNKKRRLLTFLSEQENSLCSVSENNQIILTPSKTDQILFNSGKSDQILLNPTKTDSITPPQTQTLFLQPCINTPMDTIKQEQTTLIINQPPQQKNESTLIINSAGTAATLITPVSGPGTLPVLAPCITSTILTQVSNSSQQFTLTNSSPLSSTYSLVPSPNVDILSVDFSQKQVPIASNQPPSSAQHLPQLQPRCDYEQYCEKVTCYKCKLCGYLSLTNTALKHHLIDDHEEMVTEAENINEIAWLPTALKSGIQLACPLCSNKFNSGRSFKVHATEDHGLKECEAERELEIRNKDRKEKAFKVIREEKQRDRQERRKRKQTSYEAYVDANNELRIRVPQSLEFKSMKMKKSPETDNSDEEIDVLMDDDGVKDIKATDYVALVSKNKAFDNTENKNFIDSSLKNKQKRKVGRPKGSSSIGITALRKINPNIIVSDAEMGSMCEVNECAIRLKDPENLRLHRQAHSGSVFQCPLSCKRVTNTWSAMSVHLWREHCLDLELHRCPIEACNYRNSSRAKVARHQTAHTEERPWLCPLCGQAFKLAKQLRAHSATHDKSPSATLTCPLCQAQFSVARQLRLHIDSVHHKMKPFLCSFCGYSASSRSALKLHIRKHTGDKPFTCEECQYSTADHNSLRRHKMRHSGVRPYNCPYCPYSSIQSTTYKVHLKNKHAVEDVSNILFQCSFCVFKTVKESIFLAHVSQHEETGQQISIKTSHETTS
eukprot:GFUD01015727.1.p1 GENE.GFUD01015727.1~~GFUD01015727.1.p1  ORF type:complete len:1020 (-),score=204.84 GFUD01015727.1:156-3215(-)